ncbi:septation protein SepH [Paeniglutamicibacter sp. ORCA_105]|uniref:septation protein SepH n=1 Tax=Paeniglutamicibacter sp. ORCA_105 TaxID=3377336 RepID=UPI003893D3EF
MRQLRLVGIHENGESLHLSSDDGNSFVLPVDEALRSALTRAARADRTEAQAAPLSPRDIQARIRSGATAEDVAAVSGMSLERIMRYEGPVLAEREYIASQARNVEVSAPQTHDGYRSIFGEEPANLGEMVAYRIHSMGIDTESLAWDAWREADGSWEVVATFDLPESDASIALDAGSEESVARWSFHPNRKSLQNANRWAQVLSELEPLDAPVGARRLTAVADDPFDVEADGDDVDFEAAVADSEQLLDALSARRGQRLGLDEEGDDALAAMLSRSPHPEDDPRLAGPAPQDDGLPRLYDGVSSRTTTISLVPNLRPETPDNGESAEGSEAGAHDDDAGGKKKAKRSSVPSWDEIVFGRRNNND